MNRELRGTFAYREELQKKALGKLQCIFLKLLFRDLRKHMQMCKSTPTGYFVGDC